MPRLTQFFATLTRWGLGLCALLVIMTALFVSLGRQFVPLVAEYRADIETRASVALGSPLSIGSVEGRWSGLAPVLLAHDVTLGSGADALHLDSVRVVPDLWDSLLARQVRIDHLQVSGLQLSLEQASDGNWALKGMPKHDDQPFDPQQALTQLQQVRRLSVLDSQLTLEPSDHAPLTLTYVGLSLATGSSRQRLDLRATLPDGQPLAIDLNAQVRAEQWREGAAQLYLSLPQSNWAQWLPAQLLRGYKLDHLKAGGEFWLDWSDGTVQRAVARLNAPLVRAAYADRKPYEVSDLGLNAWMQRGDEGFDVQVASLGMNLGKQRWESRLALRQRAATAQAEETWHVEADRLDLTPLTPLIDALAPLPETAAAVVDGLKVTGGLRNVLLDIRPKASGDQRFSFAANLDRVGFNAYHGAPAAGNVTGSISGDLGQGELRLATDDFMLHLDPIFANAWHYKQANARLTWRLTKDDFTLIAPYIKVLGEEGKVASDFLIRLPLDHVREPYMDLRVGMTEGDGRFTSKYLPAVLSPAVDHWLRTAILKGDVEQGYFQYQGSLSHAAPEHSRSITLFFRVHDAELAFQPGWPAAKNVDGNVYIQDGDVRIDASKGQILDTRVTDVQVKVPHVPAGEASHLYVDGKFDGSLGDGLKILQQAPIGTGPIFEGWQGTGPLQGKLNLDIPLEKGHEPKVVVDFDTRDASLKIASPQLDLSKLKGSFRFDFDKGLSGQGISGQAFDKPITAQIFAEGKPGDLVTRIQAKGQIGVKRLADWLKVSQALPASGEIPYQLQVTLAGDASRLSVDSDLKGVQIDLPTPLGKEPADSRPTQFGMNLQGAQRQLDVSYAGLASFTYAAPASDMGAGRGELFVGQGNAQLPVTKGLRVRGVLDELDLDPWKQKVDSYAGDDPGGNARQVLNEIDLKVGHLKGFGQALDDVTLGLKRSASAWNLDIASQQVTGSVGLPDAKGAPIAVNLQTVRLPAPDPAAVSPQATVDPPDPLADVDPRKIPAVDIKVQRLMQGDELIGAWALKLRPTATGLAMNELDLGLKGMQLQGSGGWEGTPGASGSWFKGRLEGSNLADVLKAWKFAPTVTSEAFHLDADGRWPGSPAWVGIKRYSGSLDATLRNGQFVEIEGGAQALRVFGLLNFNSIGRRLRLDFSDLLGKGLSYDKVKGLLVASDGVYVTRTPITMEGPSTNLELDGTLDMVNDRVDAALQVALPVTNSLPIAALLVGAPAVGGALFLVDKLFGDRVARFASVNYRIEGPWKEPKITLDKPFDKKR